MPISQLSMVQALYIVTLSLQNILAIFYKRTMLSSSSTLRQSAATMGDLDCCRPKTCPRTCQTDPFCLSTKLSKK
ncbi:hypothetical protein B0H11DRAFT_1953694 [Mycena galericulata]|nr:hypothetical protein B0H11DRAFT_1953694 [Mycena galericulata]